MIQNVIKRDNTLELFDFQKIEHAITLAYNSCDSDVSETILACMKDKCDKSTEENVHVEDIQNTIEDCLMEDNPKVAKSFIIYRYEHKLVREAKDKLTKEITKKLQASNVENQNANVDEASFGGRMGEVNRVVLKDYALKYCMSRKSRNNHLNNEIYIHKLKIVA